MKLKAFLASKGITMAAFRQFPERKKEAWREEHKLALRTEQYDKWYNSLSEEELDRMDAYELLASIGVPLSPDGEPLGIGRD